MRKHAVTLIWATVLAAFAFFLGTQVGDAGQEPDCETVAAQTTTTANGGVIVTSSASCEGR